MSAVAISKLCAELPVARMPVWFIPHGGGPCFFMQWQPADTWLKMGQFLATLPETLPCRPVAIVMISAHWLEPVFTVTSGAQPPLVYDYYGFPPHTYSLRYPAPGMPQLAEQVMDLLTRAGLASKSDSQRGFDHGMFIPLKLMFPDAQIPVIQLSLHHSLDPQLHFQVGQTLAALRDAGVLLIGSGMSFHNMRGYGDPRFGPVSDQFDDWLTAAVAAEPEQRRQALLQWTQAPSAGLCHPPGAEEHLLPLMVVAGAAEQDNAKRVFSDRVLETTISAFQFG